MTKLRRDNARTCMAFVAVPALLYLVFIIYPIFHSVYISLFDWQALSKERTFIGLGNYIKTFTSNRIFGVALLNNLKWCVGSIVLPMAVGLIIAAFISQERRGDSFLQTAVFVPVVLSVTAVGLIWRWMYDPSFGLITNVLSFLSGGNFNFNWYANPNSVIYYLILAGSWSYTGMCLCLFVSGIKNIPQDTISAARIDGAGTWRVFWYIILPQLRSTINAVLIYTMANAFKVFDLVFVMTNGGPGRLTNVLASLSYETIFRYHQYGEGSAISVLMTLILLVISFVINRIIRIEKE